MQTEGTVHSNSKPKSTTIIYFTVFNTICHISITNQCFITLLYEKTFPWTLKRLVKTHTGAKTLFFLSFSLCFSVPTCYTLRVRAAEWAPVFALPLSCDLWSVWTAWPTEAARRRDTRVRAEETPAQFNRKGTKMKCKDEKKHLWHVTSIKCTVMRIKWKYDTMPYMWYSFRASLCLLDFILTSRY